MKRIDIYLLLFLMAIHSLLFAQMSGIYSINSASPTGGLNFNSFSDATDSLEVNGVNGPVVFNVVTNSGPYIEQIKIDTIPGVSASNTITFNGRGNTIICFPTATDLYMVRLNGAKYVTLDSLTLFDSSDTYGWGVHLTNGADYNTISNCTIDLTYQNTSSNLNSCGIVASSSNTNPTVAGASANYNIIINNTIKGGVNAGLYYAIILNGASGMVGCKGNKILNNVIQDGYSFQISLSYTDGTIIDGNDISRPYKVTINQFYGLYLANDCKNTVFRNNRMHNVYDSASVTSYNFEGLYYNDADAPTGSENIAYNNLIYNINCTGTIRAIYNSGSRGAHYYYNTFSLDDTNATTGTTYGFYEIGFTSNVVFKNNNISITRGGSGTKYVYRIQTASGNQIDHNNLYLNSNGSGNLYVGLYNLKNYTSLAAWQKAYMGKFDLNSVSVNPQFTNPSNANIKPLSPLMNNIATPISGITSDILTNSRDAQTPDPGAYEYAPIGVDVELQSINEPVLPCIGNNDVIVSLRNIGGTYLDSVRIYWTINGIPQVNKYYPTALSTNADTLITIGSFNVTSTVTYNIKAWTDFPNGSSDINTSNDTASIDGLLSAMSGSYTVSTTGDFGTIAEAAIALNLRGVCGPVVINIDSSNGPYSKVDIDTILGASATNTVKLLGHGASIIDTADATSQYMVLMNGARYVTLDSLNITSTGATYGIGILLTHKSDHNTISNCQINMMSSTSTSSSSVTCGIVSSSSKTSISGFGDNGNYNTIIGNTINGGTSNAGMYYAIRLNGSTVLESNKGNMVLQNTILNSYRYNIVVYSGDSTIIDGNDISRPNKTTTSNFYGIVLMNGSKSSVVSRNRIHNSFGNATNLLGATYAIRVEADAKLGSENRIYNNLIYDLKSNGAIYGVYNTGADYSEYYYNTFSLDDTSATAGTISAFYLSSFSTGVVIRNNIFSITRGGSGTKYGLYFANTSSSINADHNVLYINSPGSGSQYYGRFGNTSMASFSGWKSVNSSAYDQNSDSVAPQYRNMAGFDYYPLNYLINGVGSPVSYITEDIDGDLRDTINPDPGAYEFDPPLEDVGLLAFVSPILPCHDTVDVIVTIKNFGTNNIDSVRIYWTINGLAQAVLYHNIPLLSGKDTIVTLGTVFIDTATNYDFVAWVKYPNGNLDSIPFNDTTSMYGVKNALSGLYTVSTSGDYTTVLSAVASLNDRGVCGPVIFDIDPKSGPYLGSLSIDHIKGSSAVNTVTFLGHGATIIDTADANKYHIVLLNGADHVTLDSLRIVNTGVKYGYGILLTNQADSNTIVNCYIENSAITYNNSSNSAGIVSSASLTGLSYGNNANYNRIYKNVIDGGSSKNGMYTGIHLRGKSDGSGNRGNEIVDNKLINVYQININIIYADKVLVIGNDISRATKKVAGDFYGVRLTSSKDCRIVSNSIHNTHDISASTNGIVHGIYVSGDASAGAVNKIYNNLLYNFNNKTGPIYGLYNAGSDYVEYYYNTISLDDVLSTYNGATYAFYQGSASNHLIVKNNIYSITRGGPGSKFGLYYNSSSTNVTSDNNVVYLNSAGTGRQFYSYWGLGFQIFSVWQGFNSGAFDQNSDSSNPGFVNIQVDNYKPNSNRINNIGIPIANISTDIFNNTRSTTTPDPGAIEFDVFPGRDSCDNAISITTGSYAGTTVGAFRDIAPVCGVTDDTSGGVWYKYEAGGGQVIFSLCGSNYDTRLRIFKGTCSNLICVAGNEDYCGSQSQVNLCVSDSGETYFILIYGNMGAVGDFVFNLSEMPIVHPTIALSGSTAFCTGDSLVMTASKSASYQWNDSAMSTAQSITIRKSGSFRVVTTDTLGCADSSDFVTTTLSALTPANITAIGSTQFCEYDSVILIADSSTTYQWNDSAMSTGQFITVRKSGNFQVITTDTNGCVDSSNIISTTRFSLIPAVISALRPTSFCPGDSVVLKADSNTTYQWNDSAMSTSQFITIKKSGNYQVITTDSNGCVDSSNIISTTRFSLIPATISSLGSTSFCQGDSVVLVSNSAASYHWNDTANSASQSIVVYSSGYYQVTTTDLNSCISVSDSISVTVFPNPIVDLGKDTTICENIVVTLDAGSGFSNYSWSTGANTQSIFFSGNIAGNYKIGVSVEDANGCTGVDQIIITIDICAGISRENPLSGVRINPNPVSDFVTLEMGRLFQQIEIELFNELGQRMYVRSYENVSKVKLEMDYPSGMYLIHILSEDFVETFRILKVE